MSNTHATLDRVAPPLWVAPAVVPKLHFAVLTQVEKATFEAGLRARIFGRVNEAVRAQTASEYEVLREEHFEGYLHLIGVLQLESRHASTPVSDEQLHGALARVERDLGESWRHRLEHAINVSQSALQILARVVDRGGRETDPDRAVVWAGRWYGGWTRLNWAIDCIFAASNVNARPEVLSAMFQDLLLASNGVYSAASDAHDAIFGDPDQAEE